MAETDPYLSVVVTARNDNHGGNLLRRMQIFVDGWIAQARRHNLRSELIVVEWNPLADKPRLWQDLKWPEDSGPCDVRFIEVPEELHRRYTHAEALPLYQMIAKNVGIRRARGQFILATNIDILFSDELVSFLAERRLDPNRMYRIDRHDVMSDVPADADIDEQLAYCESHLLRVNAREGTFALTPDGRRALAKQDIAGMESGIGLGRGWFAVERWSDGEVFRWMDGEAELELTRPDGLNPVIRLALEPGPSAGGEPVTLEILQDQGSSATVQIESHSELLIPVTARAAKQRIRFRVSGGETPVENDPRILNLRVFSIRWEHPHAPHLTAANKRAAVTLIRARRTMLAFQIWGQLQHLIGRIANEGPNVTLTVPQTYRRMAASYVESGFTGLLRKRLSFMGRKRKFRKRAASDGDIFDVDSGVRGGMGWRPRDRHRGEAFRWADLEGEILLAPTAGHSSTLSLQIEPGPGVGHKSFELSVRNQAGAVVARHNVKGLTFLRISLARVPQRTEVFTLCANGVGVDAGNSRGNLNFRVFWCGVEQEAARGRLGAVVVRPAGRVRPFRIDGKAEIIVVGPRSTPAPLYLQLAENGSAPEALAVVGPNDERVAIQPIIETNRLTLELPLRPSRTSIFRIDLEPPDRSAVVAHLGWDPKPPAGAAPGNKVLKEPAAADSNSSSESSLALSDLERPLNVQICSPRFLHTNGCGDFTLLSREKWFDLRAYPEFDLFSMNIDSVFCYAAHHGGAPEELLGDNMRIYHIEHGTGSGWTPEGEAKLYERIRAKGMTFVSWTELAAWAAQMRRMNCPFIFNGGKWGLAEYELRETAPILGRLDPAPAESSKLLSE